MCYFYIITNREKKRQEENSPKNPEKRFIQNVHIKLDEEKMAKERKKKLRDLLVQTFKENHQVRVAMSLYSEFCSIIKSLI